MLAGARRPYKGKTDREIAAQIGSTERQVGVQRERLIEKLQIRSQAQLMTLAKQLAAWPSGRGASNLIVGSGRSGRTAAQSERASEEPSESSGCPGATLTSAS